MENQLREGRFRIWTKEGGHSYSRFSAECTLCPFRTPLSGRITAFGGKCLQGACFSRCFKGIKYSILCKRCERSKFARNATLENMGFPTA